MALNWKSLFPSRLKNQSQDSSQEIQEMAEKMQNQNHPQQAMNMGNLCMVPRHSNNLGHVDVKQKQQENYPPISLHNQWIAAPGAFVPAGGMSHQDIRNHHPHQHHQEIQQQQQQQHEQQQLIVQQQHEQMMHHHDSPQHHVPISSPISPAVSLAGTLTQSMVQVQQMHSPQVHSPLQQAIPSPQHIHQHQSPQMQVQNTNGQIHQQVLQQQQIQPQQRQQQSVQHHQSLQQQHQHVVQQQIRIHTVQHQPVPSMDNRPHSDTSKDVLLGPVYVRPPPTRGDKGKKFAAKKSDDVEPGELIPPDTKKTYAAKRNESVEPGELFGAQEESMEFWKQVEEDDELDPDAVALMAGVSGAGRQPPAVVDQFGRFLCRFCAKPFPRMCDLVRHVRTHTGEKPFKCDKCDKSFARKSVLRQHASTHTGEKPYVCKVCGISYSRPGVLAIHIRKHTGEKPCICDYCGASFHNPASLTAHKKHHTGDKPFECAECSMKFAYAQDLVRHVRTHTGEKPYPCQYCGKSFAQSTMRRQHERIHTGDKPHECEVCGRRFVRSTHLRLHQKTHGQSNGKRDQPPTQECEECGKTFKSQARYESHMKSHWGITTYRCDHCDKGFFTTRALVKHYIKHEQESSSSSLEESSDSSWSDDDRKRKRRRGMTTRAKARKRSQKKTKKSITNPDGLQVEESESTTQNDGLDLDPELFEPDAEPQPQQISLDPDLIDSESEERKDEQDSGKELDTAKEMKAIEEVEKECQFQPSADDLNLESNRHNEESATEQTDSAVKYGDEGNVDDRDTDIDTNNKSQSMNWEPSNVDLPFVCESNNGESFNNVISQDTAETFVNNIPENTTVTETVAESEPAVLNIEYKEVVLVPQNDIQNTSTIIKENGDNTTDVSETQISCEQNQNTNAPFAHKTDIVTTEEPRKGDVIQNWLC